MNYSRVKITTTVPIEDADSLRHALGQAGAGRLGDYSFCSFSFRGEGRFKPLKDADPHIGTPGVPQVVQEEQIEVTCNKTDAKKIVAVLRSAHPYEEPVIDILPLIDEKDL